MTLRKAIAAVAALMMTGAAAAAGDHGGHGAHGKESSAVGQPGKAAQASRTVEVDMFDTMRFKPETIDAKQGETIRFLVKNSGKVRHEMVIGTPQELKEHYAMMMKMPGMEHADENMLTVDPGKTGELVWQFTRAGTVDFACLQPGHYDAGMKGQVKVAAAAGTPAPGKGGSHRH